MMRFLLIPLLVLALALPAVAGDVQTHDITTILPGQEWQAMILLEDAPGVPTATQGKTYIAYVSSMPPLTEMVYARFYLEISTVAQGAILLRLTPEQTMALSGKNSRWTLVHIPDVGPAQLVCAGKIGPKK